jgi:farnesyl diphosphate synthase
MSFETRLKRAADEVEVLLGALLDADGAAAPRVVEAMRYSALGQGKRLRPFFVIETAALFDVPRARALRTGAALECIHCYSLVHDDLPAMDDDDLRRGKPTTHIAFDEATAILAGDGLLTIAFEILAHPDTHPDPQVRCDLVSALATASGKEGMVGGQMLDLAAEEQELGDLGEIVTLQSLKTGALFRFSCEAGAILAQAGDAARASLSTYADRIGLAFQIADDLLDAESTAEQLGKRTQKDAVAGKATFIDLLGLDGARARANELVGQACDALGPFAAAADTLKDAARFIVERKK